MRPFPFQFAPQQNSIYCFFQSAINLYQSHVVLFASKIHFLKCSLPWNFLKGVQHGVWGHFPPRFPKVFSAFEKQNATINFPFHWTQNTHQTQIQKQNGLWRIEAFQSTSARFEGLTDLCKPRNTLQRHPTQISLRQSPPPSPWSGRFERQTKGFWEVLHNEATNVTIYLVISVRRKTHTYIYSLDKQNCFVNRAKMLFSNLHNCNNCEIFPQKSLENNHTIQIVLDHDILKYLG